MARCAICCAKICCLNIQMQLFLSLLKVYAKILPLVDLQDQFEREECRLGELPHQSVHHQTQKGDVMPLNLQCFRISVNHFHNNRVSNLKHNFFSLQQFKDMVERKEQTRIVQFFVYPIGSRTSDKSVMMLSWAFIITRPGGVRPFSSFYCFYFFSLKINLV